MSLLTRLLGRKDAIPEDAGPLFGAVRDAMLDVQAYARSHGGDIQLLSVNESGDVRIRFRGACAGCPMSALTLKVGIEDRLRTLVPGVGKVEQIDA